MKRSLLKLAAVILLLISLTACSGGYHSTVSANWDIELPKDYTETYRQDSGASFHGDGYRYHVFSYETHAQVDALLTWEHNDIASYTEKAENILDALSIPEEERPDYENCSYWYAQQSDGSELILFWNSSTKILCIVESFL